MNKLDMNSAIENSNKLYRSDIDGLRAIAVISVLAFHFKLSKFIAPGGFVGVDIFFVISGYLITGHIYEDISRGKYKVLEFYRRRVRRLFPALFVMFLGCLLISFFFYFPSEFHLVSNSVNASIFFASNILFYFINNYFDAKNEINPLLHTWSLSVEEQFYIIFPVIAIASQRLSRRNFLILVYSIGVLSFVVAQYQIAHNPTAAFYFVQNRAWELLIGAVVALRGVPTIRHRLTADILAAAGLIAIAIACQFYRPTTPFPGLAALLPCAGAAAIIYAGENHQTWVGRLLSLNPVRFIGLISYSLYLWHWPVFVFSKLHKDPTTISDKSILLLVSFFLAVISWRFIERPFRTPPFRFATSQTVFGAVGIMAVLAALTFVLVPASAAFHQIPARAEQILAYQDYNPAEQMREGRCFLTEKQSSMKLFDMSICLGISKERPNILIIGDSHAAHLWWGLQQAHPDMHFLQATASGCRPLINAVGQKRCTDLMAYIFNVYLPAHRLDGVILSGRWNASEVEQALSTAKKLRKLVPKVYIFGPIQEYDSALPHILARAIADGHNPEQEAQKHMLGEQFKTDADFASNLLPEGVYYTSIQRVFCRPHCITTLENDVPLQFDYGHLTKEGAFYLAQKIKL